MSVVSKVIDLATVVGTAIKNDRSRIGELEAVSFQWLEMWAEESSALNNNSAEWSWGNGATGNIGVPLLFTGWELVGFTMHTDVAAAGATTSIEVRNFANGAATIHTFNCVNQGQTNNFVYIEELATPVAVPDGAVIGFRTVNLNGSFSDGRVCAWLRRPL